MLLSQRTLNEMLLRYQSGSSVDFKDFFRHTSPIVYKYFRVKLENTLDADECCQETYLRIHKYIATYDSSKSSLNWLLSIAQNVLIDRFTKLSKNNNITHGEKDVDNFVFEQNKHPTANELREVILSIDPTIGPEDVKLLISKFLWDQDYEDLEKTFSISQVNLRKKISRLLKRLKENINHSKTR